MVKVLARCNDGSEKWLRSLANANAIRQFPDVDTALVFCEHNGVKVVSIAQVVD